MIQVDNLTKYYNDFCAVDDLSLRINKGEILGLLGPNGAGKTTILRMLTGFFRPTLGTIKVKEFSISEDSLEIKRILGYLPESAPLYHNMLVLDYLDYVAKVKGILKERRLPRLMELSELCGLGDIMHKSVNELSKGLKQRVGLAHALMADPEILVLDEPTSGLDPNQIAEIRAIIRRIGKKKTIIFSTHILSEAEATCDRIVIINRGRIVADDTTQNLKTGDGKEGHLFISLANADSEKAMAMMQSISGVNRVENKAPKVSGEISFELHGADNSLSGEELYLAIKKTDWIITEMKRETRSLETIFQELTRE